MAKQAGLAELLLVDGTDISGDVGAVQSISAPSAVLDVTAINVGAHERIYAHHDGALTYNHYFNDAVGAEFPTMKAKGAGANRVVTYLHGSTIGNMAAGLVALQITFDWTRGTDGSLAGPTECLGNGYGLEYCEQLTAGKRTDASATNGASFDAGAATSLGLSAYLQVLAFSGTSVTAAIQSSSDDGGGDAYAAITGGTFTAASAVGAQHIVTSLTQSVERYLRVVTTGTFSNAQFVVVATRYPYNG